MEMGYEEDRRPSLSLGSLEQKYFEEVMELVKERDDAADAENTCLVFPLTCSFFPVQFNRAPFLFLLQRIVEINNHYRDKLSSPRAQQANRRKEFLLREHLGQRQEVPAEGPLPNTTLQAQGAREIESIPFPSVSW